MIRTYKLYRGGLLYVVIDKKGNIATSPSSHEDAEKYLRKRKNNNN